VITHPRSRLLATRQTKITKHADLTQCLHFNSIKADDQLRQTTFLTQTPSSLYHSCGFHREFLCLLLFIL